MCPGDFTRYTWEVQSSRGARRVRAGTGRRAPGDPLAFPAQWLGDPTYTAENC